MIENFPGNNTNLNVAIVKLPKMIGFDHIKYSLEVFLVFVSRVMNL